MTDFVTVARTKTIDHITDVQDRLAEVIHQMKYRASYHDQSKLTDEELRPLAEMERIIAEEGPAPFGSEEYERRRQILGPMLEHHYRRNSHHPEHYPDGVSGMCLIDVIEMIADWKAASKRSGTDADLGLDVAFERFGITGQLASVIRNTARRMDW